MRLSISGVVVRLLALAGLVPAAVTLGCAAVAAFSDGEIFLGVGFAGAIPVLLWSGHFVLQEIRDDGKPAGAIRPPKFPVNAIDETRNDIIRLWAKFPTTQDVAKKSP